jgi:hypothetical protein
MPSPHFHYLSSKSAHFEIKSSTQTPRSSLKRILAEGNGYSNILSFEAVGKI